MSKINLTDITSLQNEPTAIAAINANNAILEDMSDRVLYRDGTIPNQMNSDLDMNSQRIFNLPQPLSPHEPARLADIGETGQAVAEAVAAAQASAASAAASSSSATASATSATASAGSATAAAGSATAAAGSATAAAGSATNALNTLHAFQDIYLGPFPSNPTQTPSGDPLAEGMLYFNTSNDLMYMYTGTVWTSVVSGGGGTVSSVFGRAGAVTAQSGDYNFNQLSGNIATSQMNSGTGASSSTYWRGDGTWSSPAGGVTSVFGRNGAVVAQTNDYNFNQLSGNIAVSQMASGTNASATTFWSGAGTWIRPGRELLTSDRTYYVRTDGNDSNTGLVNNSGGAFLTIQKAIDTAAALDSSVYNVTIQVGAGTYSVSGIAMRLKPLIGGGRLSILGDETNPANVVVTSTNICVYCLAYGIFTVNGFTLNNTGGGQDVFCGAGNLTINNNAYIGTGNFRIYISGAGAVVGISGAQNQFGGVGASNLGLFAVDTGGSLNFTTSPVFKLLASIGSASFTTLTCRWLSPCVIGGLTFNMNGFTVTGTRYNVNNNAIVVGAGSTTLFPGTVAGVTATGGIYG